MKILILLMLVIFANVSFADNNSSPDYSGVWKWKESKCLNGNDFREDNSVEITEYKYNLDFTESTLKLSMIYNGTPWSSEYRLSSMGTEHDNFYEASSPQGSSPFQFILTGSDLYAFFDDVEFNGKTSCGGGYLIHTFTK